MTKKIFVKNNVIQEINPRAFAKHDAIQEINHEHFRGFAKRNRGRSDREVKNAPAKELRSSPQGADKSL